MNDFFASLFELWGAAYPVPADHYFDYGIYQTVGIVMLSTCILSFLLFYYIINSPHFSKTIHWILMMLAPALITGVTALAYPMSTFSYEGIEDYVFGDFIVFPFVAFVWSLVFFFLLSLLGKWWSTNCRRTPF